MKTLKKLLFPFFLVLTCGVVWFWQHSVASLPYLPYNCIVPLGIMTPSLIVLTFITSLILLKQSETAKPVLRTFLSTAAMFVPVIATAVFFLSFVSYRFSEAVLPVLVLPNWPTGIATLIITALCIIHLTGLLAYRLAKKKAGLKYNIAAAAGWIVLNVGLFLITL
ncbi:MAG: hypothetical protein IK063_03020 [Clostridia bacterium]|nr:hypothetical protein [Clostridia bacterium]